VVVFYLKRWGGVIGGHNTSMIFRSRKVGGWVGILRSLGRSETTRIGCRHAEATVKTGIIESCAMSLRISYFRRGGEKHQQKEERLQHLRET